MITHWRVRPSLSTLQHPLLNVCNFIDMYIFYTSSLSTENFKLKIEKQSTSEVSLSFHLLTID